MDIRCRTGTSGALVAAAVLLDVPMPLPERLRTAYPRYVTAVIFHTYCFFQQSN